MNLRLPSVRTERAPALLIGRPRVALWRQVLSFAFGFSIQFDVLIGGGGQGASATGGYGYRLIDFLSVVAVGLLAIHCFNPKRILLLSIYSVVVVFLFAAPALSSDPRTAILTYHYILYAFATLYIAILVHDETVLERFCLGLVVGLGATIPIFVLQAADYSQALIAWGLMPGYAPDFVNSNVDFVRYSGMLGHPNEAGHVATLSAAGGAYFALVRRRMFPLVMVACALILVFYYTRSRGGLLAGGAVLVIPFVLTRGRASVFRVVTMIALLSLSLIFISQLDFVASRFADDQNSAENFSNRVDSVLAGLQVMFEHPFGMPLGEFLSSVGSESGGVLSPHNGFIFLGGIFGIFPLIAFLASCISNFRVRSNEDVFFALLTFQVMISLLFEQLPGSYTYAVVMCLICAQAFLKMPFCFELLRRSPAVVLRRRAA